MKLDELKSDPGRRLVMVLRPVGEESRCLECGWASRRVHSRYKRQVADLPWEDIPVRIELRVRRFFCSTDNCSQRIFTERLPNTVGRHGRRTCRLSSALDRIISALGGSAGSRLAQQLGILADGPTLLRALRRRTQPVLSGSPRVVGIDDWAPRKGLRYGTILCDLERGAVIDLLPDRSTESAADWLRGHPGIEIVSPDRASLYAEAARRAACGSNRRSLAPAPQSQRSTGRCSGSAPPSNQAARTVFIQPLPLVTQPVPSTHLPTHAQHAKQQCRDRRFHRYKSVMELVRKGMSQGEIYSVLGVDRRTVRRWTRACVFPERKSTRRRSAIDEYRAFDRAIAPRFSGPAMERRLSQCGPAMARDARSGLPRV